MVFKGQDGPCLPVDGSFLVFSSIYVVGDDRVGQMNEGEAIKRKEVHVHEISGCTRVNECSGVNGFVLSL